MDDVIEVTSAEQFHAFGHPLRQRILHALGQNAATISQLATILDVQKGSIAHHLKVLREAGLVRLGHTKRVRGGTEQYHERSARKYKFAGPQLTAQTALSLHVIADDMAESPTEPLLIQRRLRLTAAQLEALSQTMYSLADNLEEAEPGETPYGVLFGIYQPRP